MELQQRIDEAKAAKQVNHVELILKQLLYDLTGDKKVPPSGKPKGKQKIVPDFKDTGKPIDTKAYERLFKGYTFQVNNNMYAGRSMVVTQKTGTAKYEFLFSKLYQLMYNLSVAKQEKTKLVGLEKRKDELQGKLASALSYFESDIRRRYKEGYDVTWDGITATYRREDSGYDDFASVRNKWFVEQPKMFKSKFESIMSDLRNVKNTTPKIVATDLQTKINLQVIIKDLPLNKVNTFRYQPSDVGVKIPRVGDFQKILDTYGKKSEDVHDINLSYVDGYGLYFGDGFGGIIVDKEYDGEKMLNKFKYIEGGINQPITFDFNHVWKVVSNAIEINKALKRDGRNIMYRNRNWVKYANIESLHRTLEALLKIGFTVDTAKTGDLGTMIFGKAKNGKKITALLPTIMTIEQIPDGSVALEDE